MSDEGGYTLNKKATIVDESWLFRPGVKFESRPLQMIPNHIHLGIESKPSLFDDFDIQYHSTVFRPTPLEKVDMDDMDVVAWLKAEMIRGLNAEFDKEMDRVLYGDGSPIPTPIKENYMSDRQLRTPEGPIETKDLTVAIRALGVHDLDYLLDAVALVQALESNQRLTRAEKLKQQDVGSYLQIVDGVGGVLTDLRDYQNFGRDTNGMVKAVVGGKMVDLRPADFVVLTALAN